MMGWDEGMMVGWDRWGWRYDGVGWGEGMMRWGGG